MVCPSPSPRPFELKKETWKEHDVREQMKSTNTLSVASNPVELAGLSYAFQALYVKLSVVDRIHIGACNVWLCD